MKLLKATGSFLLTAVIVLLLMVAVTKADTPSTIVTGTGPNGSSTITIQPSMNADAEIVLQNRRTDGDQTRTLVYTVSLGEITVDISIYETYGGGWGVPTPPDVYTITGVTEGYMVVPEFADVEEDTDVVLQIFKVDSLGLS